MTRHVSHELLMQTKLLRWFDVKDASDELAE